MSESVPDPAAPRPRRRPPEAGARPAQPAPARRPRRPNRRLVLQSGARPLKQLIIAGLVLAFTLVMLFNQYNGSALMLLIALAGFLWFLFLYIPGTNELRLGPEGMSVVSMRRPTLTPWDKIGGFAVELMPSGPPVVVWWHTDDCHLDPETGEWLANGVRLLPDLYGYSAPELRDLLDSFQDEMLGIVPAAPAAKPTAEAEAEAETEASDDETPAAGA